MHTSSHPAEKAELSGAEILFQGAFKHAAVGMVVTGLNGEIEEVNTAYGEALGYSPEELRRKCVFDLVHPEDRARVIEAVQPVLRGELPGFVLEARYVSRSGSVVWVHASGSLLRDSRGNPRHLVSVVEDITRQHAAEEARLELFTQREALLNSAAEGIYGVDLQGICTFINPAAAEMLGYMQDEVLGKNVHNLIHYKHPDGTPFSEEECVLVDSFRHTVTMRKSLRNMEETLWRKDGSAILVEHSAEAVIMDGRPCGTVVTLRDVTERNARRAERAALLEREQKARREAEALYEALRESETTLRDLVREKSQLFEAIPQMVWATDANGKFQFCNQRWHDFTGLPKGECDSDVWLRLVHEEDFEKAMAAWKRSLACGSRYEIEFRMRRKDGDHRWLLTKADPLLDEAGNIVRWFGTSTDIHEQKLADTTLRRTEKLAAAGRLAATVAHEINNPLEAVTNLIYLAIHAHNIPAEAGAYLEQANDELRRVAHIVSQTLGFYRDSSAPRETDISALVKDVLYLYQRKMNNRQIRICTRIDDDVKLSVIPGEIRQVVANLVANAIHATAPGGIISAEVHRRSSTVELVLSDTGHGISPEHLEHIFEPFYTTKKDVGTGLGLWVSKGIVEKHSGSLSVQSSTDPDDHGTVFSITLPL